MWRYDQASFSWYNKSMTQACMSYVMMVKLAWNQIYTWVKVVLCSLVVVSPQGDTKYGFCKCLGLCKVLTFRCC